MAHRLAKMTELHGKSELSTEQTAKAGQPPSLATALKQTIRFGSHRISSVQIKLG
jgi:hypothetical protein